MAFFLFHFTFIFRVLTINVRGLSEAKLDLISDYFVRFNVDVCFVQETQVSCERSISSLSARWDGEVFGPLPLAAREVW